MSLSLNIVRSNIAIAERWVKLYRRIHNLFLSKEFVHIDDYKTMFKGLNKRIDDLNQKLDSNLNTLMNTYNTHTHPVATTGSPAAQAGTAAVTPGVFSPQLSPLPPVPYTNVKMIAADNQWRGLGPASAPLGSGSSLEAVKASSTAAKNITAEG